MVYLPYKKFQVVGRCANSEHYLVQAQKTKETKMKKAFIAGAAALCVIFLTSGCLSISIGGGSSSSNEKPTTSEQLEDLKKARDSGAITEEQYQTQRTKLLQSK